jgi:hypothetical protein
MDPSGFSRRERASMNPHPIGPPKAMVGNFHFRAPKRIASNNGFAFLTLINFPLTI